jgi:hypothetical protein
MTVYAADAHVHRLVSVVKIVTVHEVCNTEEQSSVVRFFFFGAQKVSMQRIFIKTCLLFTVGSVCRVKRFTAGWQTFH